MKKIYRPLPSSLTIKSSSIEGLGLFSTEFIENGRLLGITHVYDDGFEDGLIRTPLGGFFNHSEKPNIELRKVDSLAMHYWSSMEIHKGKFFKSN